MIKLKDIYMRDPFVYVEDGVAYLVGTTDETCWGGKAKSFLGFKSTDLENFEGPFVLFEAHEGFWADENYWAPELHKVGNKYLLVASFFTQGRNRRSQVLTCDTPLGRYVESNNPFTPEEWMSLDATLYEENGKLYTIFCHEWLQVRDGEMVIAEINQKDYCSLVGEPKTLFKASSAPWAILHKDFNKEGYITDGPFIYKLSNGDLIMLWSSHGLEGYACGMALSTNGVQGPWQHIEEPLFKKDGGHGMIFKFKNQIYLSLHCPNGPHLAERPHFYKLEEQGNKLVIKE